MTRAKQTAYRFRRLILIAGIFYTFISIVWVFLPLASKNFSSVLHDNFPGDFTPAGIIGAPIPIYFLESLNDLGYGIGATLFFGLLFFSQWWFLRPRSGRTILLNTTGKPLKSAVIIASCMAMLLTVGAVAIVLELFKKWASLLNPDPYGMIAWISMLLIWSIWAWIFYVYWRQGDRYTQFGKMIRGLVAGSVIEALVAVPVHIVATRKTQCYCEHGSYTSLVFSGTVLLWAFGPGIYLLYQREKYRLQRLFPVCDQCGYDLRASKEICPECGTPVPANSRQSS